MKHWFKKLWPFIIITISCIVFMCVTKRGPQAIGDSADYWMRGEAIWENGFSLYHIDGFRGYVFPLLLGTINKVGGIWGWKIFKSVIYGILFGILVPDIFNADSSVRSGIKTIFVAFIWTSFYWGLLSYALSDLLALTICVLSIWLEIKSQDKFGWRRACLLGLLGISMYWNYNIRSIYMFADFALVVFHLIRLVKKHMSWGKSIVDYICMTVGMLLAAIPQICMNWRDRNIFSAALPTGKLMFQQIVWGITYQRYDTWGGSTAIHEPQVVFVDSVGKALFEKDGISELTDWGQFITFMIRHFVEMAGIYARHVINMLFPCWPEQIVLDFNNNKFIIGIIAYSLLFGFGLVIVWNCIEKYKYVVVLLPAVIPALVIIPGAVEARFFVAVWLYIICTLGYNTNWKKVISIFQKNVIKTLLFYVLCAVVMFSFWSQLLASEASVTITMW